ncbi:MAG: PH domain-containing protein [Bellilinea sp.]
MAEGESQDFYPPRRRGLIFHLLAGAFLLAGSIAGLILAFSQPQEGRFVLLLLGSVALFAPLPWVFYRGYALMNAFYRLERDGLRLRWGLRAEDIPLPEIEWVRPASELGFDLPLPPLIVPGAVLGSRQVAELGTVEFMASETNTLLLVAARERVFAISPQDGRAFNRAFQRMIELGSLTPLQPYSAQPAALARRVWDDRPARWFLIAGLILTTLLLIIVALAIPSHPSISLGFDPQGQPLPPVEGEQLLLLPVLGILIYLVNLLSGIYFYRRESHRAVAFMVWIASAFTPLLLLIAAGFILLG